MYIESARCWTKLLESIWKNEKEWMKIRKEENEVEEENV